MGLFVPLSINDTHHNKSAIMLNVVYAEYRVSFKVMLNVIMLSVVMPNVVAPNECRYLLQWVIQ